VGRKATPVCQKVKGMQECLQSGCQLIVPPHLRVQALVLDIRDSRVAEAVPFCQKALNRTDLGRRGGYYGPVVKTDTGFFIWVLYQDGKDLTMSFSKRCSFYKELVKDGLSFRIGYCYLDNDWTTCQGDIQSCKKLDVLRKHLLKKKRVEWGLR